jgi:hypothetical protein
MDGGYAVAGYTTWSDGDVHGSNGNHDFWIVKLNDLDSILWETAVGGSAMDYAMDLVEIDTGFVIVGGVESNDSNVVGSHGLRDGWVVMLNDSGTVRWKKCYGGSGLDWATSIEVTAEGGYIVAGSTTSNDGDVSGNHGNHDAWVLKLSDTASVAWGRSLGGGAYDAATDITQTTDGGYIMVGNTRSNDGDVIGNHGVSDAWIVKLNGLGEIVWANAMGGSADDSFTSVRQTADGGYIAAGSTSSNDGDVSENHGGDDIWIVKLDAAGGILWQKSVGGSGGDHATAIERTAVGGYIVAGNTNSHDGDAGMNLLGGFSAWLIQTDEDGDISWQRSLGGSANDQAFDIEETNDGGFIMATGSFSEDGDVTGNHGGEDMWIVKFNSDVGIDEGNPSAFTVSPNPTNGTVSVWCSKLMPASRIELIDMLGRTVMSQQFEGSPTTLDLSQLSRGLYSIRILLRPGVMSKLVLLE